jgi:hypothetical protein
MSKRGEKLYRGRSGKTPTEIKELRQDDKPDCKGCEHNVRMYQGVQSMTDQITITELIEDIQAARNYSLDKHNRLC